jgi:hypothetical protein
MKLLITVKLDERAARCQRSWRAAILPQADLPTDGASETLVVFLSSVDQTFGHPVSRAVHRMSG